MASKEQVEQILKLFENVRPNGFLNEVNKVQAGIGAVLRFLNETEGTVTAGKISDFMGVSTARVAVLLKKMAAKDLIVKENDASDARVTVVKLSDHGRETVKAMREDLCNQISEMIDKIGMDKMLGFINTFEEIKSIMSGPPKFF